MSDTPRDGRVLARDYGLLALIFAQGIDLGDAERLFGPADDDLEGDEDGEGPRAENQGFLKSPDRSAAGIDRRAARPDPVLTQAVPPWGGLFLDGKDLLGLRFAEAVDAFMGELGHRPEGLDRADHLSAQLDFSASLAEAEAVALEQGREALAALWRRRRGEFLAQYVLPWLLPFEIALEAEGAERYASVAAAAIEAVGQDCRAIFGDALEPFLPDEPPAPEAPGLEGMALTLASPAHIGAFLSARALRSMGWKLGLALSCGDRPSLLAELLAEAAEREVFPGLMAALDAALEQWWISYWRRNREFPVLVDFWQQKSARGRRWLKSLEKAWQSLHPRAGESGKPH